MVVPGCLILGGSTTLFGNDQILWSKFIGLLSQFPNTHIVKTGLLVRSSLDADAKAAPTQLMFTLAVETGRPGVWSATKSPSNPPFRSKQVHP